MDVYTLNFEDGTTLDVEAGSPKGAWQWADRLRPGDELRSVIGPDGDVTDAADLIDFGAPRDWEDEGDEDSYPG